MSDIDIAAVDSLKVLDPNRPIREADKLRGGRFVRLSARRRTWANFARSGHVYSWRSN